MTIKKTAHEMMNPDDAEFDSGKKAAPTLIEHMKRMGAAGTKPRISDDGGVWEVTVVFKSGKGQVNRLP